MNLSSKSKIARRFSAKILLNLINWQDKRTKSVTTFRKKSLSISKGLLSSANSLDYVNLRIGILLQGQLIPFETIRACERYLDLYPNIKIVFSTWKNQDPEEIDQIKALGVHVIENEKPEFSGPSNINLQIVSTKSGLNLLSKLDVEIALKTRSDGLLSSDYFLEYLMFLFRNFTNQGERIIIPSYNSFLFRLYSPTDQFQFGKLEVLLRFWSCPKVEEYSIEFRFSESYLVREYLSKLRKEANFTIEDSLSVYRDYFVIAENSELGLVLNKGTKSEVSNRWANDGFPQAYSEIHFWHWLELQQDIKGYLDYFEGLPNRPNS